MDPKGFHRKLTAILSADVAGYSGLMPDDKAATATLLDPFEQEPSSTSSISSADWKGPEWTEPPN